jgi:hypothetical protein
MDKNLRTERERAEHNGFFFELPAANGIHQAGKK